MKPACLLMAAAAATAMLGGCASQSHAKYSWGAYDTALYSYYKDGGNMADYQTALQAAIQGSETTHKPVAPGLYAEYGYLLLQQKRNDEAVVYFQKEKAAWPESSGFMDGMIKTASSTAAPVAAAQAPAVQTSDAAGGAH